MNITVVTPYDSSNYGAFLQAYCLQQYLMRAGHAVTHIPTRPADYVESLYYHKTPSSKKEKLVPGVHRSHYAFGKKKYELFREAQKVFQVKEGYADTDLVVLGSDEIWNVKNPVFTSAVFWGEDIRVPAISYAASIGDASEEDFSVCPDQISQLRRLRCALVRDENTRRLVGRFTSLKPEIVCDPTILWPVEEYGEPCADPYVEKHDCLLIYSYALSRGEVRAIRSYAKKRGLRTVSCCFHHRWCDHQVQCGPLAFPDLIRKCREYYTTTFHGAIFGMLCHARFVCCSSHPKTLDLLAQYGLQDRLLSRDQVTGQSLMEVFSRKIRYQETDRIIRRMRQRSQKLLDEAVLSASGTGMPEEAAAAASGSAVRGLAAEGFPVPGSAAETADSAAAASGSASFEPLICYPNLCTGCFACREACRHGAVGIATDAQGRSLPVIDESRCTGCGACRAVCPRRNDTPLNEAQACYAARGKDTAGIEGSSSGGIAAVLTSYFLENGAVVCGALACGDRVVHRTVSGQEEAGKLKGSKYVQSDLTGAYEEVRKALQEGKKVLFIGTPCQVDAMNRFFGKNPDFFAADIICHGVPPVEYLSQHLREAAGGRSFDRFRFRGSPDDFTLKIFDGEDVLYAKQETEDPYFHAFLASLTYRENCYNCKYTRLKRAGDLTLGDFWGINEKTLRNRYDGNISVVLVNTGKGRELFDRIRPRLVCEERPLEEAAAGNPQLRRPSLRHRDRGAFLKAFIQTQSFASALSATGLAREMERLQFGRTKKGRIYVRVRNLWQRFL